ncbi:unnamed protein product, partial [Prorocentrum cordatum]
EPLDWAATRATAEKAIFVADWRGVEVARTALDAARRAISDAMELELQSRRRPRLGWVDLLNANQRLAVQMASMVDQSEAQAALHLVEIGSQTFEAEGVSARLDLAVAKAWQVVATWPRSLEGLAGWVDQFAELQEELEGDLSEARGSHDGIDMKE